METAEYVEPGEIEELEIEVAELESQLEGLKGAEIASVSCKGLVESVQKAEGEDLLVIGSEKWKPLIVREEPEPIKPTPKGCCAIS
jgi:hypothetical protein